MFRRNTEFIRSGTLATSVFVQSSDKGDDVQNSELYYMLDHHPNFKEYTITKFEHRIDLISNDIYGDTKYAWVLMYLNRISLDKLLKGVKIKYITKSDLQEILSTL